MKFGVREICDVVLKKRAPGWFGKLYLEKNAPVMYFESLKTSSLEGQATTVYAQGGKGNPRLVAWEGDRTVTFTMEDALISPESFSILSGAGLMDATEGEPIYVHTTQQVEVKDGAIILDKVPSIENGAEMYLMIMKEDGSIDADKIPLRILYSGGTGTAGTAPTKKTITNIQDLIDGAVDRYNKAHDGTDGGKKVDNFVGLKTEDYKLKTAEETGYNPIVYVDYYVKAASGVKQIDIEAGKFGGSYYLEASTLWRDQSTGDDYPAEFIIPNCKVQSNFTFTMAPTGDPSTFTFTLDAFPEYTRFNKTKKVIAAIQIVEDRDGFGAEPTTENVP